MKLNPMVSHLSLYDIAGTPGVAADVSHINTRSEVLILHFYSLLGVLDLSLFGLPPNSTNSYCISLASLFFFYYISYQYLHIK